MICSAMGVQAAAERERQAAVRADRLALAEAEKEVSKREQMYHVTQEDLNVAKEEKQELRRSSRGAFHSDVVSKMLAIRRDIGGESDSSDSDWDE